MENNLSKNLKTLRHNAGYTLEEMAKFLGLSGKTSYLVYESGKSEPKIDAIIALSKLYNVKIDDLILEIFGPALPTEEERKKIKINRLRKRADDLESSLTQVTKH